MTFLRDRQRAAEVWRRFRHDGELFTSMREDGIWVVRVGATAERTLELFHELAAELTGTVQLSLVRLRDEAGWHGSQLALADVREGIARLRVPLASAGGVEVSVYTADDQLTVSAQLALHLWSRSDRWRDFLLSRGLQERRAIPDRRWARSREDFATSPALDGVIESIASVLSLSLSRSPATAPADAAAATAAPAAESRS